MLQIPTLQLVKDLISASKQKPKSLQSLQLEHSPEFHPTAGAVNNQVAFKRLSLKRQRKPKMKKQRAKPTHSKDQIAEND